ncbi:MULTISPECIES: calcineurin-like phosphoesterase family protein [Nocardiopsidaceae]|uniref:Calcineurin-like phosphoesterase family protein n=1 Tax=Streptomonospora nanhaiensis TaxID=1323731 RepID=A0ABY6YGH3_9ACTN|nr:calcineurin-like phosphoesterase family protein [Streptomonospora nanhaiensis]WAE71354.1 calcineurin-like phosphoesterase family protein [Streptomonospora nanhaiensis]
MAAAIAGSITMVPAPAAAEPSENGDDAAYRGGIEVVRSQPADDSVLTGRVFVDADRNSVSDRGEDGLAGVVVTNGRDVVRTDRRGRYELPAFDNMTVSITQPSGYQVPMDEHNIPQFHYNHLPEGSPELRYGGIEPTGPLPSAINFPVVESGETGDSDQSCVIAGDLQTYDEQEVEYARAGAIRDLAERDDYAGCGTLFVGDVVGDDLSLYPAVKDLVAETNGPARFLPGNHDLDFDAPNSEHSFDTFRAQLAPEYYSYDVGDVHVVALNTVDYPCTAAEDSPAGIAEHCADPEGRPAYNGRIDDDQLAWLEQDLAHVDRDKLVVVAGHIGLLNYADESSPVHQVDQVRRVHELLEGRRAVALSGHSHSIENLKTGDDVEGWRTLFGVEGLPFPHITAGAISGDWYSGEVGEEGYPTAIGRDGGRPGLVTLDIEGNEFQERYTVTGESDDVQTQLGINSPTYREWFAERQEWNADPVGEAPELDEPLVVDRSDLAGGSWLTTNFFFGSTGSTVEVSIDGGRTREATRTQQMEGEDVNVGVEYSDPYAISQQLVHGGSLADRTMHLWRFDLPRNLRTGEHTAEVTATDSYGREFTDTIEFEVVGRR